jgi:hypothetical protein
MSTETINSGAVIYTDAAATSQPLAAINHLVTALAKAQAEMTGAAKDKTNPHFKSAYADLASVWDACRGPLSKHGLAVIQHASADGPLVSVETVLAHSSGQWVSSTLTMTAQQNTPQGIGSCITYARRYALSSIVGIAPEDDDGNAASQTNGRATVTPIRESAKKPDGYDAFLKSYQESAKKGLDALRKSFKEASEAHRAYLTRHDGDNYEASKAQAETVTKNSQPVTA